MFSKSTLTVSLILLVSVFSIFFSTPLISNQLTKNNHFQKGDTNSFHFTFRSISSILRTTFTKLYTLNDTIFVGDNVGSVAIWTYDAKKKKLDYQDISRKVQAVLPKQNKVIHLQAQSQGVVVLTADGSLTTYVVDQQSKLIGNVSIQIAEKFSWFTLIKPTQKGIYLQGADLIAGINQKKNQLCLYMLKQSIAQPNPVTKIQCNLTSTNLTYDHIAFDPMNNLISVGDQNKAIVFQYNISGQKPSFMYLTQANLPKVEVKGFQNIFANGTLLAINDLWINSIYIDTSVPSARVISAQRTQKILKSGETSHISAYYDQKLKRSLTIVNSKNKVQGFSIVNNKLSYLNDSKSIGGNNNFMLRDLSLLYAVDGNQLGAFKVGDLQQKDYITLQDKYSIQSSNHFKSVKAMALWNSTFFVSVSEGGLDNIKLWNYTSNTFKLSLVDQKTITYFTLMKAGIVEFLSLVVVPPPTKQDTNVIIPYHIAAAGADPFSLYIFPITTQDKFGTHTKSKDSHYSNITSLFLTSDKKNLITTSMDSTVKIWRLSANHDQVEDNTTTVLTKNGPISAAVQSRSGSYYAFAHCNTLNNKLANISIWKQDTKVGLLKIAQNVPGEAHQTNLTNLILTQDQKYLISLSLSGQMRLWRLQSWTMVDLMASLAIGIFDATIKSTPGNNVLLQCQNFFSLYYFDQNGFILLGRQTKPFQSIVNSSLVVGNTWFSGDDDGSIRIFTFQQ